LQRAWAALDVPQCGYCQSGQILAAAAVVRKTPRPTDADIDAHLPGMDAERLMWLRAIMTPANSDAPACADGLSATYCGHTIDVNVRRRLSHVCLDTGAFLRYTHNRKEYGLTLIEHATGGVRTYLLQKARYVESRPDLRQVLVVPGARDSIQETCPSSGCGATARRIQRSRPCCASTRAR
jgi:hypothetical protein